MAAPLVDTNREDHQTQMGQKLSFLNYFSVSKASSHPPGGPRVWNCQHSQRPGAQTCIEKHGCCICAHSGPLSGPIRYVKQQHRSEIYCAGCRVNWSHGAKDE